MKTLTISKKQASEAIQNGEFGRAIRASNRKVAVVMTQDWCHEWKDMKDWIDDMHETRGLYIYLLIYNTVDYFKDFLPLKEKTWGNDQIPYIRYYSDGLLIHTSNYVQKDDFLRLLGL